jgi:hypothetical protein
MRSVFGEECGLVDCTQSIEKVVRKLLIIKDPLIPGVGQMPPGRELTIETARPSRVFLTKAQLTRCFHKAVGNPALKCRIGVGVGVGVGVWRSALGAR